jgi:putative membrane protein
MIKAIFATMLIEFSMFAFANAEMKNSEAQQISDGQIVQILLELNSGEVKTSELAQQKATRPEVKQFAAKMINEHRLNNLEVQRLSVKNNVAATTNPTSRDLKQVAETVTRELKQKSGADFDRAYITHQVMMHESAYETINSKLIPKARNAALKKQLESTRDAVMSHLEEARTLQDQVSS